MVGTGPAQQELEALAEKVGIGSRVRWLGGMPRHWLESVWPTLDCVVLPARTTTRWVEPVGQALLDAMAQGLPVVGTDSGVLPEIIGDAGIVVQEDDPDVLGLALERLQKMPDEQARLGAAGRRRVMAEYVDDAIARKTLTFWRQASGSAAVGATPPKHPEHLDLALLATKLRPHDALRPVPRGAPPAARGPHCTAPVDLLSPTLLWAQDPIPGLPGGGIPNPATLPPEQARALLQSRPDLAQQVRERIAASGLTPEQIRSRLRRGRLSRRPAGRLHGGSGHHAREAAPTVSTVDALRSLGVVSARGADSLLLEDPTRRRHPQGDD